MRRFLGWIVVIGVVIALDQWSKLAVLAHFAEGDVLPQTGYFNLVLVYNKGAAFSFLAGHPEWGRWFFICLAVVVSVWLLRLLWQTRHQFLQPLAFTLVIGGALGNNLIDRVIYGKVVDFLDFHYLDYHYPAFNVADSAICLGVALIALALYREHRAAQRKATENPS